MRQNISATDLLRCDGTRLKHLAEAGLAWLDQNHETVNQLNVFPVPDGDTGTNMLLTMRAAYHEIAANLSDDVGVIADKLAYGAIMGSRGNSGTILSQLLRGLAQTFAGQNSFDANLLSTGLSQAVKMAYKAVQTPVEGTILTVAREVAEEVEVVVQETSDLKAILERAVARARLAVARTPDLLPILKKAGVVDSGGQGLTFILEGMLRHLNGEVLIASAPHAAQSMSLAEVLKSDDAQGYGYDVQYILRGQNLDLDAVRTAIAAMGDSMVVVGDESLIKVHIHVHDPGVPISYGIGLGIVTDVVVENMQEQSLGYIAMREGESAAVDESAGRGARQLNPGDIGVVAVVPGEGLRRVFEDLGVACVVTGGQTMNPSTEELLQAAHSVATDKVILLPNNKNIILAAEQAAQIANEQGQQRIAVVSTRTIPQGITAMLSYAADGEFESVIHAMDSARESVVTGEVTTATRSVEMDGVNVKNGQVIALLEGKLAVSGDDLQGVVRDLLRLMAVDEREVITLYYGNDVTQQAATELAESLRGKYPDQEFEVVFGGQPHYYYIISAE